MDHASFTPPPLPPQSASHTFWLGSVTALLASWRNGALIRLDLRPVLTPCMLICSAGTFNLMPSLGGEYLKGHLEAVQNSFFLSTAMSPSDSMSIQPSSESKLQAAVKDRFLRVLVDIISKNRQTQFFRESDALESFRKAAGSLDEESTHDLFRTHIPFTTYDTYLPYISRFRQVPCLASSVRDLMSPGLPRVLVQTSGTSGSSFKFFPKYSLTKILQPPEEEFTRCSLLSIRVLDVVNLTLEDGGSSPLPITIGTSGNIRIRNGIHVGDEPSLASKFRTSYSTSIIFTTNPSCSAFLCLTVRSVSRTVL